MLMRFGRDTSLPKLPGTLPHVSIGYLTQAVSAPDNTHVRVGHLLKQSWRMNSE